MVPKTLPLTDTRLLRKIKSSVLTDTQKNELEKLIPRMSEPERVELSDMIDHSVQEMIEADPQLQQKAHALSEEYEKKLHALVSESNRMVRDEFEKLDKEGDANDMRTMETAIDSGSADAKSPAAIKKAGATGKPVVLKITLILIVLAAVAGAILFALGAL